MLISFSISDLYVYCADAYRRVADEAAVHHEDEEVDLPVADLQARRRNERVYLISNNTSIRMSE